MPRVFLESLNLIMVAASVYNFSFLRHILYSGHTVQSPKNPLEFYYFLPINLTI